MRIAHGSALAIAIAMLIPIGTRVQGQETAKPVAGGGISVPGWTGKIDASEEKAGQTLNNAKAAGCTSRPDLPSRIGIRRTKRPATTR